MIICLNQTNSVSVRPRKHQCYCMVSLETNYVLQFSKNVRFTKHDSKKKILCWIALKTKIAKGGKLVHGNFNAKFPK